ncbi:MAG: pentapeptide repeat-containing protein [Microcystaceae cyanobacterium]
MANPEHLAILNQGVEAWNQWRRENPDVEPDLREADLSNRMLTGIDFTRMTLYGADLRKVNLSDAFLCGSNINNADLREAILCRANISGAMFIESNLSDVNLTSVSSVVYLDNFHLIPSQSQRKTIPSFGILKFKKAKLVNANCSNAIFKKTDLTEADLSNANFYKTNLTEANLSKANLEKTDFSEAIFYQTYLKEAQLTETTIINDKWRFVWQVSNNYILENLEEIDLSETDLSKVNFNSMSLIGTNFRQSKLIETQFMGTKLNGADFRDANLSKADCRGANFTEARLEYANCEQTNFSRLELSKNSYYSQTWVQGLTYIEEENNYIAQTDFTKAHLESCELKQADLKFAIFHKAHLIKSLLFQANLSQANFTEANLEKCHLSFSYLHYTNFSHANLTGASLTEVHAQQTNFEYAILTGVCIENWMANQINLDYITCDFIYLKPLEKERRPHDPDRNFADGEFALLVYESLSTVDLIFSKGIDWQVFLEAFQKLQVEYDQYNLEIIGLKNYFGYFLVQVQVPPDCIEKEKAEIEKSLLEKYNPLLEAKEKHIKCLEDELEYKRKKNTQLVEVVKTMAEKNGNHYEFNMTDNAKIGNFSAENSNSIGGISENDSKETIRQSNWFLELTDWAQRWYFWIVAGALLIAIFVIGGTGALNFLQNFNPSQQQEQTTPNPTKSP